MRRAFPWSRLGIDPTSDRAAIRKAYADALRATDVDADIAGYADLRRARDEALWLAAQADRAGDADDEDSFGLGDFDDDWDAGDAAWDDAPASRHPDPLEPEPSAVPPQLSEAQLRAQEAWQVLLGVLYPDDEASDEAVTLQELAAGEAALATLIARAEEADLEEHDALDGALATLFARTWPRSAPFVEPADAAFHWLDEAGSIEERPALVFLNQRLKGMRFHEKVQEPGHPLHKAWAELSRPGRAGVIDRLRVKRLDVHQLLTGIRDRYPELESFLDPQRVASWEGGLHTGEGNPGGLGPSAVRWFVVLALIVTVALRLFGSLADGGGDTRTVSETEVAAALSAAEADIAATEIFGKGTDMAAVRAADPVFADQLRAVLERAPTPAERLEFVRFKAVAAGEVADFKTLVARLDLRNLWVGAAARQSAEACRKVMAGDFAGLDLALDETARTRERELLRQLLEAGVLSHMPTGGEVRYAIPGWLVAQTLERSGLSEDRLVAALTDPASKDRCKAEGALIEAVLAKPGRVPAEVLKAL